MTANILFSGIGAQERGFRNSGLFDIDIVTTSEINKEAVVAYAAIHCGLTPEMVENYPDYPTRTEMAEHLRKINLGYNPEKGKAFDWFKLTKRKSKDLEKYWLACNLVHNGGDICNIKSLPYADLWTCSFPCTDISIAGSMKGLNPDSGTRSSLLWENIRLLKQAKDNNTSPKYIMFENVKNLVSKKFLQSFNDLINILDELGFNTYWSVLNGKTCGIPQNRERVFAVAVRKDIDTGKMDFPKPFDNGLRLKDMLQDTVDDKYYLSEEKVQRFLIKDKTALLYDPTWLKTRGEARGCNEFCPTLMARDYKDPKLINENSVHQVGNLIHKSNGWDNPQTGRVYSTHGCSPTLNTCGGGQREPKIIERKNKIAIRKLTPTECFRLMGFNDADCKAVKNMGISDSQLYKQTGNSIITNCVSLIAEHLYKAQYNNEYICLDECVETQPQTTINKPKLIGGIGEPNWAGSYRQGNRVYDSKNIAVCLTTTPVGSAGAKRVVLG